MPFVKGKSGNPAGGRSQGHQFARLVRSHTREGLDLIEFALETFTGTNGADLSMRFDCMKWLADRGWGKATETIVIEDETQREVSPQAIAVERLESDLGPIGVVQ